MLRTLRHRVGDAGAVTRALRQDAAADSAGMVFGGEGE
jgi:hypothetical protein